jgi:2,3-bisphosphoglycerate-independent phosphoglycerate mutase
MSKKMYAIIIMDGFAYANDNSVSAINMAGTPNIDRLKKLYSNTTLGASGEDVGLPHGQMGNSEVGHLNIGAGRIVYQELTRISKSIDDGAFYQNEVLLNAVRHAKNSGGKFHIMGLLSDGGVHSHITHLYSLIKLAKTQGLPCAYIHCFTDGRDVSPVSGINYVKELEEFLKQENYGKIASVCGRYYAMDRDNRWDRVEKAYDMLTAGSGKQYESAAAAFEESYSQGVTDEFIKPVVISSGNKPVATVSGGDSVVFFNFRPDRARELTRAFTEDNFSGFNRDKINDLYFASLTQYDVTFDNVNVAFKPQNLQNTLGEYIAAKGYRQIRIAETEKYAHVTFFFNGGIEKPNLNEDRVLVSSPKVATYDLKPEMSAYEVTEKALEAIESEKYDVLIMNYANCDMVGHTGFMDAAQIAVKTVDECAGRVVDKILEKGGSAIITADHGNADRMYDEGGNPFTAHSTNPVPFILADKRFCGAELLKGGRLADIAPTLLYIMGEKIPSEMTGKVLIKH